MTKDDSDKAAFLAEYKALCDKHGMFVRVSGWEGETCVSRASQEDILCEVAELGVEELRTLL